MKAGTSRAAVLLALAVTAPILAAPAAAQERVTISGKVVDAHTRRPIPGVRVELAELDLSLTADAEGVFELRDMPVGVYELRLSAPGYAPADGNFAIMRPGSFVTTLTPRGTDPMLPRGRLVGRVVDVGSEQPLADVRVGLPDISMETLTDQDGRFAFGSVPPGRHRVDFEGLGYAPRTDTISVVAARTSDARVAMTVDPLELEPVDVVVERRELVLENRGFYQRREMTSGTFVDREDIEAWGPSEATDIFRRINGARIRLANPLDPLSSAVILTRSIGDRVPCYPSVYLDGILVHRSGDTPAMLNQLVRPDRVAGIEVYRGGASVPVEYGGTSGACGVLVVWTRG
ncbi:MAG: carboxypeptidase regulatory-like domain-containing protein [Longimicrobiales bacterium]